ncbi:MAG: M3 family metallopeptidase, partial [Sideroxydans sp.]
MTTQTKPANPLLDFAGLPRFAEIKPEHVAPAIEQLLDENRALITRLLADDSLPTWDAFVRPMEDANERLGRAWGPVGHLNAVMNSPELRDAYNSTLPKITAYYAELGQNLALFQKFKALRNSAEFAGLSAARKKIIENELRDFRLGGAELPDDKKTRYLAVQERQSELSSRFSDNILDATNEYTLVIENRGELDGLPEDVLQTAREAAQAADKTGWLFTLKAPSYLPVMQFADNRDLREKMYRAYATRASDLLPDGSKRTEHPQGVGRGCTAAEAATTTHLDNTPLMDEIVTLRAEEAQLLGFANFGELSLAAKMAETPQQVVDFMRELAQRARPFAEKDLVELREFAKTKLDINDMRSWDVAYASEKLREQRYAFSEQEVKQYF